MAAEPSAAGRRVGLFALGAGLAAARAAGPSGRARISVLAFARQDRDRRSDLHSIGALGDQDLGDRAFVDSLELHRRLVGLDFGQDVAGFDLSPSLTSHLASVPSSIVGDRAGILSSIGMGVLAQEGSRGSKRMRRLRVKCGETLAASLHSPALNAALTDAWGQTN